MMREILFRAKRDRTDEWVVGYYDGYGVLPSMSIHPDDVFCNIDSETLGQFTGRYTKDGVRIFEGDIVRLSLPLAKDLVYTAIGKIVYDEFCAFSCETISKKSGTFSLAPDFMYEVIGNIYDNPELLKGESNE